MFGRFRYHSTYCAYTSLRDTKKENFSSHCQFRLVQSKTPAKFLLSRKLRSISITSFVMNHLLNDGETLQVVSPLTQKSTGNSFVTVAFQRLEDMHCLLQQTLNDVVLKNSSPSNSPYIEQNRLSFLDERDRFLVGVLLNDGVHRAIVVRKIKEDVEVELVDIGVGAIVIKENVFEVPDGFQSHPWRARSIAICGTGGDIANGETFWVRINKLLSEEDKYFLDLELATKLNKTADGKEKLIGGWPIGINGWSKRPFFTNKIMGFKY